MIKKLLLTFILLGISVPSFACRFWVGVGEDVASTTIDHLIIQPNSLKALGDEYKDGWSVGYYDHDQEITIARGDQPSNLDPEFDNAIYNFAEKPVTIAFSHLRRASSGCIEGVPNPHPFTRERNGINWAFGHNGGMTKQVLIDLIGDEYLTQYPPEACTDNPPETWIDSELYFIYLLKSIEEHEWNVDRGLEHALKKLYTRIEDNNRYLNFFLSDGEHVWTYRKGTSLYYLNDMENNKAFVSSTVPEFTQGHWKEYPEYALGKLTPNQPITLKVIGDHVSTP